MGCGCIGVTFMLTVEAPSRTPGWDNPSLHGNCMDVPGDCHCSVRSAAAAMPKSSGRSNGANWAVKPCRRANSFSLVALREASNSISAGGEVRKFCAQPGKYLVRNSSCTELTGLHWRFGPTPGMSSAASRPPVMVCGDIVCTVDPLLTIIRGRNGLRTDTLKPILTLGMASPLSKVYISK